MKHIIYVTKVCSENLKGRGNEGENYSYTGG
jgi:hypothetical protein